MWKFFASLLIVVLRAALEIAAAYRRWHRSAQGVPA